MTTSCVLIQYLLGVLEVVHPVGHLPCPTKLTDNPVLQDRGLATRCFDLQEHHATVAKVSIHTRPVRGARPRYRNLFSCLRFRRLCREPPAQAVEPWIEVGHDQTFLLGKQTLTNSANRTGNSCALGVRTFQTTSGLSKSMALNRPCSRTSHPFVSANR